jgi:hypothetical protein
MANSSTATLNFPASAGIPSAAQHVERALGYNTIYGLSTQKPLPGNELRKN